VVGYQWPAPGFEDTELGVFWYRGHGVVECVTALAPTKLAPMIAMQSVGSRLCETDVAVGADRGEGE